MLCLGVWYWYWYVDIIAIASNTVDMQDIDIGASVTDVFGIAMFECYDFAIVVVDLVHTESVATHC